MGMALQRAGGARQPHAGEGVVVAERGVRQAGQAVRLALVEVLPVGVEARRARRVRPEQEGVQLLHRRLAHAGLELPGEERWSGGLLRNIGERRTFNNKTFESYREVIGER